MDSYRIGFIGAGVMGEAIINGALQAGSISAGDIYVHDIDHSKLIAMVDHYSVNACVNPDDLVSESDIIILAVKPVACKDLLENIAEKAVGKALVSIVAGWNSTNLRQHLKQDTRLLCVMPNTPAVCGEGMSVFSSNNTLLPGELQFVSRLFSSFGEVEFVDEKYFDIVTGVSGSGPAYVFMFIEALASAGVYGGLAQKTAKKLAIQTVLGSAKALKNTDRHPADMRDAVCTPAGTTIEAVFELEKNGFNGIVMAAVDKCAKKYKQMISG